MGVSIHYRGRVAEINNIKAICDELAAIADRMNWPCTCLDEDWSQAADASIEVTQQGSQIIGHLPLKGIALKPHPKCESLQFFFDANGHLRDLISMVNIREENLKPEDAWISVKSQFAGSETHIWIIALLKYLKKHHLPDLEVQDEGEYWETGNFKILKEKMDFFGEKIAAVGVLRGSTTLNFTPASFASASWPWHMRSRPEYAGWVPQTSTTLVFCVGRLPRVGNP